MDNGRLMWTLMVVLLVQQWYVLAASLRAAGASIAIDSHFTYVVVGGDHVAESVGRYLSARDPNKTVLVLKGSRCNDVLEPSEPSALWLEASYLFAESAHYLGYEFIDPCQPPSKPGIAFTNQTMGFAPLQQQLYAVDPNLKLLTDARPTRIIYNKASSTVLGVEVSINYEPHYIFAKEELIIAGRCTEDYRLLSRAEVLPDGGLLQMLHNIPLEIALKSPIISPIFTLSPPANATVEAQQQASSSSQSHCLLATELYIETLPGRVGSEGTHPNAKVNIIVNENPPNRWIGFSPSVISLEAYEPQTIQAVLVDTIELCTKLGSSETFQKLGLTLQRRPGPPSPSCPADNQPGSLACFVNHTLSSVYGGQTEAYGPVHGSDKYLTEDFRLRTSRNLRVLPFGLTAPFLEPWWPRIFTTREKMVREYTTRIGILRPAEHQSPLDDIPIDTLLEKLKERLRVIDNIAARRV